MKTNIYRRIRREGIIIIMILLYHIPAFTQTFVCEGEEVTIRLSEFRGDIQWEKSADNLNWEIINGENTDSIKIIASDSSYFRANMSEGVCNTYYTQVCSLFVFPEVDIVIENLDTVCIESDMFDLTGGSPSGGVYSGQGVIDGRFLPWVAGVGNHTITYTFQYEGSECIYTNSGVITVLPAPTPAYAGQDSIGIVADSISLYANSPDIGKGEWRIISGQDGIINDITDSASYFKGGPGEHLLEWSIESDCGYSVDTVKLVILEIYGPVCPGIPTVTDEDGNIYRTVLIGERCWMGENLRTGTYINSDNSGGYHSDASNNGIIEKYCYDNDEANCAIYGGLYDWNELMSYGNTPGARGICPEGWHIPSYDEWVELDANFALRESGKAIKEGGSSGFEAKLAGDRHASGNFYSFDASGFFWTSTQYDNNEAWFREVCYCNDYVDSQHGNKLSGMSVRCIKDN